MKQKYIFLIIAILILLIGILSIITIQYFDNYESSNCTEEDVVIQKNDLLGNWKIVGGDVPSSRVSITPFTFTITSNELSNSVARGSWEFKESGDILILTFNQIEKLQELPLIFESPHTQKISQENGQVS